MMSLNFVFCVIFNIQIFVFGKTTIVFYDDIKNCDEFCSKNECFDIFDLSNIKLILDEDDDTKAYLNGSVKTNVVVNSPQPAIIWTEKRYGTKWATEAFFHRYQDACKDMNNPLDPAYKVFKGKVTCPHPKGKVFEWNMYKINLPVVIPSAFIGEWRMLFSHQVEYEGNILKQCVQFRGDVYEA